MVHSVDFTSLATAVVAATAAAADYDYDDDASSVLTGSGLIEVGEGRKPQLLNTYHRRISYSWQLIHQDEVEAVACSLFTC